MARAAMEAPPESADFCPAKYPLAAEIRDADRPLTPYSIRAVMN
jgi:hypothetical protein